VSPHSVPSASDGFQGMSAINLADGEIVETFENIYGCVPIIETQGITSSARQSDRHQLAIFDHMTDICLYLDQLVSQKATAVRQWAWATPIIENTGKGSA